MNDFPKQLRKADDVRLLATFFRYLQEKSLKMNEQAGAHQFEVLADAFDWVCGLEHEGMEQMFEMSKEPFDGVPAGRENEASIVQNRLNFHMRKKSIEAIAKLRKQ